MDIGLVKDYYNIVYFVEIHETLCRLIKYDIYTRRKHIIFEAYRIYEYYVDNSNLVIQFVDDKYNNFLFWNNFVDKPKRMKTPRFCILYSLIINNKLHIVLSTICAAYIYKFNDCFPVYTHHSFQISSDGKRIIKSSFQHLKKNIYITDINNLNALSRKSEIEQSKILTETKDEYWLHSSILICFCKDEKWFIQNLDTNRTCTLDLFQVSLLRPEIFIVNKIILVIDDIYKKCSLYDIVTLNLLTTIPFNIKVVGVNNISNVLIANDLQYFRINHDYYLKKVNIGYNYFMDRKYVPNKINLIMNAILDLIDLPPELLNIELYSYILVFCL